MNPAPNLFVIGPMGAGKSTVGRHVAELMRMPFHDLDHEIEVHTGATIGLIFELEGEAGFRKREAAMLAELATRSGVVVATGGGAILDADNRQTLQRRGYVIWLDASIDAQLARLARDRQRPLLQAPDRRVRLEQLARDRNPLYAQTADLHVESVGIGNSMHMAHDVLDLLEARWQRGDSAVAA